MDPTKSFRLARILKGVAKSQKGKGKLRPIRLGLLEKMLMQLGNTASPYLQTLMKAILLVTYHGCFRIGEVVLSGKNEHYMKMENISFIYKNNAIYCLKVRLPTFKHSKHAVSIKIRTVTSRPCPVMALVEYLKVRGDSPGPVFRKEDGDQVNRAFVASHIKRILKEMGKNECDYNTHSIRSGRTTDMLVKGVPEHLIKRTGRWRTEAFESYIRIEEFTVPGV